MADAAPLRIDSLGWSAFIDVLSSPVRRREFGGAAGGLIVVEDVDGELDPELVAHAVALPVMIVVDDPLADASGAPGWADAMASGADLEAVVAGFRSGPQAATTLALLLRGGAERSVADGLVAESMAYSALQGGDEFRRWLAAREARRPRSSAASGSESTVEVTRHGDVVEVVLARPEVRNALNVAMRDELWEAFSLVASDPEVTVRWSGQGPSFCSGGDLDEFGTLPDPATGHLVRLTRSVGWAVHEVAARTTVHVHGPSAGSGVELAAFAGTVLAAPDSTFVLPEVGLGLVPGAGGTVSLSRRIGRHRTAWLALTGSTIDAEVARRWGLVDEIAELGDVGSPG